MSSLQLREQPSGWSMMLPTVVISAHAHLERVVAPIRSGAVEVLKNPPRPVELLGSAKQIAHSLGLSIRTAHIHRTKVMHKFGVENRIELVRAAERLRCCSQRDRS